MTRLRMVVMGAMLTISSVGIAAPLTCWEEAGNAYRVDPFLLAALSDIESGRNPNKQCNKNTNGTFDCSIMRFNSATMSDLQKKYNISMAHVVEHPCYAVKLSAWRLRQLFNKHGENWAAVGMWNTGERGSPQKGYQFAMKVWRQYQILVGQAAQKTSNS